MLTRCGMVRNFLFCSWLILISIASPDLKAEQISQFQTNQSLTQRQFLKSFGSLKKNDLLLIGLEPYLGRNGKNFQLKSAGKNLILKDAQGIIHKSSQINIGWRKIPLESPKKIVRNVAGPFPSFESAQQFALKLKNKGISSTVAHPMDWEVWVSPNIQIPNNLNMVEKTQIIRNETRPFVVSNNLDLLLLGPISIEAPEGLLWEKGLYKGPFLLKADAYGSWTFIEKVSFPQYLKGVVPHEIGGSSPNIALAVQAVLARTWALANLHRFKIDGYHLCSDVQCQVYKNPEKAGINVKEAIQATSGKYLSWQGKPIHAVYHATNGGVMASAEEAWSIEPLPYLRSKPDGASEWTERFILPLTNSSVKALLSVNEGAYGSNHYLFRWRRILTAEKLKQLLYPFKPDMESPKSIQILKRGNSGRVLSLAILGSQEKTIYILKLDNIRRIIRELPSTLFVINQLQEGIWEFSGGGFGHGAGLSQAGAIELAHRDWTLKQILMHYYPGTDYVTLP